MSDSISTLTTELGALPDVRRRFIDNDAPVMFSYKLGGGEAERRLRRLVGWPGQWIGYDVDTPDAAAIVRAEDLLRGMKRVTNDLSEWRDPHVTAGQDGELVLEWWGDQKKLTMYLSAGATECIRVWGPNVDTQMDEPSVETAAEFGVVWNWLNV